MHRIAVVEDDTMMQNVLKAVFEGQDCELRVWGEGRSALAGIAAQPPDLILLDVHLPDMTGHDVCRALKADARTRSVPVLMLTGEARALEQRVAGLELGAEDYLFKPFSPKVLLARVRSLLKSGERAR